MKYLDAKKSAGDKCLSGNQWYLSETIRSINQGIGRIIRHKKDFGSIYLVDSRFKRNDLNDQISTWAKNSLKIVKCYSEFEEEVQKINGSQQIVTIKNDIQPEFNITSLKGTTINSNEI